MQDLNKLKKFLDDEYRVSYLDSHVKGSVAYQILALREKLGLNQTEFGRLVGMPQSVISRLESGEGGGVNINTLLKIANGLKIGLAVRFCDFATILAENVSPEAFLVENIEDAVSRLSKAEVVVSATSSVNVITVTALESHRTWQTQPHPNQPFPQWFPGSATLNFGTSTPTQAIPA